MKNIDRLPLIPEEQWTQEQKQAIQEIIQGPRGALIAPFIPLMRSPELMTHAQRMGAYLRYGSSLPLHLSELAILITARHYNQLIEWSIHQPIASKLGIHNSILQAIASKKKINDLSIEIEIKIDIITVYNVCNELHNNKTISDATWSNAAQLFGEQGIIDLIGINGYYALLGMIMNASKTSLPDEVYINADNNLLNEFIQCT